MEPIRAEEVTTFRCRPARMIHRCRERVAALFGCQPEQVVFTKNCTESLNIVIKGLAQPGDHFIISDLEHNAVYRVVEQLRRQGIIEYSVAAVEENEQKTVWNFEHLIRPNTRMIVCTQASNVFGMRVPGGAHRCNGTLPRRDDDGGRCAERGIAAVGPQTAGNRLLVSAGSQGIVRTGRDRAAHRQLSGAAAAAAVRAERAAFRWSR